MTYVEIVKESIEYIEENLKQTLSLEKLAGKFYVTKYHYSRIFKAVTGISVIDYYRKRKFTEATKDLKSSENNILEIAFDYGYNSQEAFSRAYKKYMGCSPKSVKKGLEEAEFVSKFIVLGREFKNYKNTILSNHKIIEKKETIFWGRKLSINFENFIKEKAGMKSIEDFVDKIEGLNKFFVFTFITTSIKNTLDLGMYVLDSEKYKVNQKLEKIILVQGKYLEIEYNGKMQQSWRNVNEDIKMIVKNKGLETDKRVINFYQEFSKENADTEIYKVYVPLKD